MRPKMFEIMKTPGLSLLFMVNFCFSLGQSDYIDIDEDFRSKPEVHANF